ncbi:cytidylyltransferase domain-containing protein [Shewanella fidelis]|uniref:cytidylyltransferase domain-containing protein n=1 Tax=Shewanella fidelis TaxID=173509 RepID=UPI00048E1BDD|nr:NTP transferase domain-containing protein [Shewanella fidelis]
MTNTLAIVGARLNSSRLPNKHLLQLAGKPMIERICQRLKQCQQIDTIQLATTADEFNQPLIDWAADHHVNCTPYTGDVNDLMARLDFIIQQQQPRFIVYICGDCPLIDPGFIDHAITSLSGAETKDTIQLSTDIKSIHEGMAFYTLAGWNKLMQASQCAMSREHVGYADSLSPVLNKLSIADSDDFSAIKHRISVDTQADYRFMAEVYQRWYAANPSDSIVSLTWVIKQLQKDENLLSINAHVNQKAPDRQYEKVSIYCQIGPLVGLGHLKRCALIADALQEQLSVATEVVILGEETQLPWLKCKPHWFSETADFLAHMNNDINKLLIIDLHPEHIPLEMLETICLKKQHQQIPIVALDKMSALLPWCDLLFVPSFYSELSDPKVDFGWQNYLLPTASASTKQNIVLILTGGSDALGYGDVLPDLLLPKLDQDWRYVWVQGPMASAPNIMPNAAIECLQNPADLNDLIATAKIVVTCYGLSLFESMAQGAAVILLPTQHLCSENELKALRAQQACEMVEKLDDIAELLVNIQSSPMQQARLAEKCRSLFTTKNGLTALANHVRTLLDKNAKV